MHPGGAIYSTPSCPDAGNFLGRVLDQHDANTSVQEKAFKEIFSGDAPRLRSFSAISCRVDLTTPWFQNLNAILLGSVINIYECLSVISVMPNLQDLTISYSKGVTSYAPRPVVSLPKLNSLSLNLEFDAISFLLDHLRVPQECSLNLLATMPLTRFGSNEIIASTFAKVTAAISSACRQHFRSNPPRTLDITFSEGTIIICDGKNCRNSKFKVICDSFNDSAVRLANISASLAFPEMSAVTEFTLTHEMILPSMLQPCFIFLRCLSSVETLKVNEQAFSYILAVQDLLSTTESRNNILFPNLAKICFVDSIFDAGFCDKNIVKFIFARIRLGHPLSVLDITAYKKLDVPGGEVHRLLEVSDLKVLF